jgi:hypothetical protein
LAVGIIAVFCHSTNRPTRDRAGRQASDGEIGK